MTNQHALTPRARVDGQYVERALGITRSTRLRLEDEGVLHPFRLTTTSHRRYDKSEIDALAERAESGVKDASGAGE